MIQMTAQRFHEYHIKLHIFGMPHNCKEFQGWGRELESQEILEYPIYLFIYHYGENN